MGTYFDVMVAVTSTDFRPKRSKLEEVLQILNGQAGVKRPMLEIAGINDGEGFSKRIKEAEQNSSDDTENTSHLGNAKGKERSSETMAPDAGSRDENSRQPPASQPLSSDKMEEYWDEDWDEELKNFLRSTSTEQPAITTEEKNDSQENRRDIIEGQASASEIPTFDVLTASDAEIEQWLNENDPF